MRRATAESFWARVDRSGGPDACWPWLRYRDKDGYGRLRFATRDRGAHQVAFELGGGTIPAGHGVLHRCDTPACCNPAHLWTGTNEENTADRNAKGRTRGPRGEEQRDARLTEALVREIRAAYVPGATTQAQVAARFGLDEKHVQLVVSRRRWKHVA